MIVRKIVMYVFFFNDAATTKIYTYDHTLSRHDALPILTAGASVALVGGYGRRDVPDGVRGVATTAGGRLFANLKLDKLSFTVGATKAVAGGTRGVVADASLSYALPLSDRMTVIPTVGTSWANGKHMNRYFGIDAGEALASGLPLYRAGSGFKDVSGLVTASYRLDAHWSLGATGGVTRLLGDAADSPLNEQIGRAHV